MKRITAVIMALVLVSTLALAGCSKKDDKTIRIAHKNYTEQRITGPLMAVYIEEKTDYKTEVTELGGTMLCYGALKNDEIDMYAEFTGSAYGAILEQTQVLSPQETYDYVKKTCEEKDGITWLKPLGWNNTYILSVRQETAEELNLKTISDLVPVAKDMILGSDNEFIIRTDGLPGFTEKYGLEFKEVTPMDQGLTYAALKEGQLDVNVSWSTDGRIKKFDLVNLEDDLGYFPPYYVTPIMKMTFADANPDIVELLNELGGNWTEADMQGYNLLVDEGANATDVARNMLKDKGLIS
ncbi:MAG: glycine/betaine ABC transporter substrate-binding protein [Clostridiales bacterium]|nr:glycine/betaine ABC transporter substrate-binding protein [Clostridiales bacterium]